MVFDVALEGSARKLVTVRSALVVVNKLVNDMEIKLETKLQYDPSEVLFITFCFENSLGFFDLGVVNLEENKLLLIPSGESVAIPIPQAYSDITARPAVDDGKLYTYCAQNISYMQPMERVHELKECHASHNKIYR